MSKPNYTDFPYCYDEERYFVSSLKQNSKHEKQQNEAIKSNTEAIRKNTADDEANRKLDDEQSKLLQELLDRVKILEDEIEVLKETVKKEDIVLEKNLILYPTDKEDSLSETEKELLTLKVGDTYTNVIGKLAKAIQGNSDTIDGDTFI